MVPHKVSGAALGVAFMLVLSGCQLLVASEGDGSDACLRDTDCLTGDVCRAQRCVAREATRDAQQASSADGSGRAGDIPTLDGGAPVATDAQAPSPPSSTASCVVALQDAVPVAPFGNRMTLRRLDATRFRVGWGSRETPHEEPLTGHMLRACSRTTGKVESQGEARAFLTYPWTGSWDASLNLGTGPYQIQFWAKPTASQPEQVWVVLDVP